MKTHTTILSIKLINKAVCLLFAFLALFATCEVQTALIVTRYNMTVEGSSHLVTLNAKTDGDPFNLAGDRTPYRTLIDVTSGVYNLTFVDTVPGFVAWSYIGSNHNNTNGIALGSILPDLMTYDGLFGFSIPTTQGSTGYSTQQAAFNALSPKTYNFNITGSLILFVYI